MDNKNLTLQDITVGDYVQEWSEIPQQFSMPMYVDSIFSDGDIYLNFEGNEADVWETKIKDIYDIPIDFSILSHFGFDEIDTHLFGKIIGEWKLVVHVFKINNIFLTNAMLSNKSGSAIILGDVSSVRLLQHKFYNETKEPLKLVFE